MVSHLIDYTAGLAPLKWPQDRIVAPKNYGYTLPQVGHVNDVNVKREYYQYAGAVLDLARGEERTVVIPVTNDADYYWSQISAFVIFTVGQTLASGNGLLMSVSDAQSGYRYHRPGYQLEMATSVRTRGEVLSPNFTVRGSGLNCQFFSEPKAGARVGYDIYFTFIGWKEYRNVAT